MRKRFYILLVSRDKDGQLRKLPIPVHYLYVFLAGAVIGMLTITGLAGSYTRMLVKVARFDQLRTEKEALKTSYSMLEERVREKELQVATLGLLASEVSTLYGLKTETPFGSSEEAPEEQLLFAMERLNALRSTALTGAASIGIGMGLTRNVTVADWVRAYSTPNLWPVAGRISGSFGERLDPFHGEGAFHSGIDISTEHGSPVFAPADAVVVYADYMGGYGKILVLDHGNGFTTRFGHLANFAARAGQNVSRGEIIGYVGSTGRSTGPHLHYEVRIRNAPVNPYRYLRMTLARSWNPDPGRQSSPAPRPATMVHGSAGGAD